MPHRQAPLQAAARILRAKYACMLYSFNVSICHRTEDTVLVNRFFELLMFMYWGLCNAATLQ